MNAKWHIINHLACAVVFLSVCSFSAFSQERDTIFIIEHDTVWMDLQPDAVIESQTRENRYDRRVHRYRRHWEALIPTHTKIQFAGNMGLLSFGTGWDYGRRNQWETDVFFGVLPKYDSKRTKLTFTVKQNYLPWSLQIKQSRFSVEPPIKKISVKEAARCMGKSDQFVRIGLQRGLLPFGNAVPGTGACWNYYINPTKFRDYVGADQFNSFFGLTA